jgi:hypothetical protein
MARERTRRSERPNHTHHRPGARLDGMVGQSLRGQPEAAWGRLHRAHTGSTTPRCFYRRVLAQLKHQRWLSRLRRESSVRHLIGGVRWRRIPRGKTPRSPRRRSSHKFQLEDFVEGVEATILPKHQRRRPPEMAGVTGRRWRRSRYRQRARGEREESEGARLGRLTDPDPSRFGLTEPGGPVGSNGPRPIW